MAASTLFPNLETVDSYNRVKRSESSGSVFGANPTDVFSTGLSSGWELDVFGGLRRGVESADAATTSSIENYRDVLVTLFADVALNYIDYRTYEERISVANRNIGIQKDSLDLAQSRLDAGLVSKIDVTQARANLETTNAIVPQLQGQLAASRNRLASLTGGYPHTVIKLLKLSIFPISRTPPALPIPSVRRYGGICSAVDRSRMRSGSRRRGPCRPMQPMRSRS